MDSFNVGNRIAANLETEVRRIERGIGCYRMDLSIQVHPEQRINDSATLHLHAGTVILGRSYNDGDHIGDLQIDDYEGVELESGRYPQDIDAHTSLSPQQLQEIRDRTSGDGLEMEISVRGEVKNPIADPWAEGFGEGNVRCLVPQSQWLNLLNRSGFSNVRLIELSIPEEESDKLEAAVSMIQKARSHFDKGDYDAVAANCRKAIESLNSGTGENPSEAENAFHGERRRDMTLDERELLLRRVTRHYMHPGVHGDEDNIGATYTRRNARTALVVTAGLISSALEKEQE